MSNFFKNCGTLCWGFFTRWVDTFIVFSLLLIVAAISYNVWKPQYIDPIVFYSAQGDGLAEKGGVETIEFTYARKQVCPAVVQGFWLDPDHNVIRRLPELPGGYTDLTLMPKKFNRKVPVPTVDDTGMNYFYDTIIYRSTLTSYCPERAYVAITPDVTYKVSP